MLQAAAGGHRAVAGLLGGRAPAGCSAPRRARRRRSGWRPAAASWRSTPSSSATPPTPTGAAPSPGSRPASSSSGWSAAFMPGGRRRPARRSASWSSPAAAGFALFTYLAGRGRCAAPVRRRNPAGRSTSRRSRLRRAGPPSGAGARCQRAAGARPAGPAPSRPPPASTGRRCRARRRGRRRPAAAPAALAPPPPPPSPTAGARASCRPHEPRSVSGRSMRASQRPGASTSAGVGSSRSAAPQPARGRPRRPARPRRRRTPRPGRRRPGSARGRAAARRSGRLSAVSTRRRRRASVSIAVAADERARRCGPSRGRRSRRSRRPAPRAGASSARCSADRMAPSSTSGSPKSCWMLGDRRRVDGRSRSPQPLLEARRGRAGTRRRTRWSSASSRRRTWGTPSTAWWAISCRQTHSRRSSAGRLHSSPNASRLRHDQHQLVARRPGDGRSYWPKLRGARWPTMVPAVIAQHHRPRSSA